MSFSFRRLALSFFSREGCEKGYWEGGGDKNREGGTRGREWEQSKLSAILYTTYHTTASALTKTASRRKDGSGLD